MELTAIKMLAGGDALARDVDGRAVMLSGALPDERVRARETQRKRDFLRAETLEVLSPSSARRAPPCPQVAAGCGGCDWQHVLPEQQLRLKAAVVQDALTRTAGIHDVAVTAGGAVPSTGYRTTLRLGIDAQGRPGFRKAGSHRVLAGGGCLVAHPRLEALLECARLPGARELTLRVSGHSGERLAWWTPGRVAAQGLPEDVRTGPDASITEVVDGVRLRVSAQSFFQSSPQAAELLCAAVRSAAGDPDQWRASGVVDAYGGVGLFAATVAPADVPVTVVESSAAACADAAFNLGDRPATVHHTSLERWTVQPAGLVIADPARAGLGRDAVAKLISATPRVLVLVSCDPVAFARDARLLAAAGWRLRSAQTLDLFPNTHHVEVVSAFHPA